MSPFDQSNTRGVVLMCVGMALFTANDAFVKLAAAELPVPQVLALRGIGVIAIMAAAVTIAGQWGALPRIATPRIAIRSILEGLVALVFVTALARLGLAEAVAIFLTSPLMMTALSAFMGRETVGWRRWLAVLLGFVGMLIVVRPSLDGINAYALLILLAALGSTVRDFITRGIEPGTPSILVSFIAGVTTALMSALVGIGVEWQMPSATGWVLLGASALFVAGGTSTVIAAFRCAEVSVISPFRYTIMFWALIAGIVFWGELPDGPALLGTGIIVASGLYIIHRERLRSRELRAARLTTPSLPTA
jgi:drug/metabolite transporter (DMT)-like permease